MRTRENKLDGAYFLTHRQQLCLQVSVPCSSMHTAPTWQALHRCSITTYYTRQLSLIAKTHLVPFPNKRCSAFHAHRDSLRGMNCTSSHHSTAANFTPTFRTRLPSLWRVQSHSHLSHHHTTCALHMTASRPFTESMLTVTKRISITSEPEASAVRKGFYPVLTQSVFSEPPSTNRQTTAAVQECLPNMAAVKIASVS